MSESLGSIVVFIMIGFASFYIIRKIYLSFKNDDANPDCCGGGCNSCSENCGCSIQKYYSDENEE